MPSLLKALGRWRHSRGFGIHSPFAFRFVTEVLCQRLPYYGYADISPDRRVRLLFRLTVALRPASALIMAADPHLLEGAIRRANSRIALGAPEPDLLVVDDCDTSPEAYMPLLQRGHTHALILNATDATTRRLADAMPHGMIFTDGRGTIVLAAYPHLPRQDFDVKF